MTAQAAEGAGAEHDPRHPHLSAPLQISAGNLDGLLAESRHRQAQDLVAGLVSLLSDLEASAESQRRFAAQVSHEMRAPVTRARALVEVALANPDADFESLRTACERVLVVCSEQEALIEALIILSRCRQEQRLGDRDMVDLADLVARVLKASAPRAEARAVGLNSSLEAVTVQGNGCLLERLVTNLVDNAILHNVSGGWVDVVTSSEGGVVVLGMANSGPVVPAEEIDNLTEPFSRCISPGRDPGGSGLGLSIVAAVASVHGAILELSPRPAGGLGVRVTFTPPTPPETEL